MLEDKPEYIRSMPPGKAEQMQRQPFELLVLCNPQLKAVGQAGARFYEGCLSVPGYQVWPSLYHEDIPCGMIICVAASCRVFIDTALAETEFDSHLWRLWVHFW